MKIRDVIILVKYAQGAVVFNSFFSFLEYLKQPERKIFLSQIVELIGHFAIHDSAADLAIKESKLRRTCSACLILKEGVNETQLQKLVELPESELEAAFKLLLTLFSLGYQEGFQKNKNAPDKFWYWDYSVAGTAFKVIELKHNDYVDLDEILKP
jgi:hypothetical protein